MDKDAKTIKTEDPNKIGANRQSDGTFGPGNVANPNGRPIGFSLVDMLRKEIQKVPEGQKMSYAEAFLRKMLSKAINEGDHASQKLIMNYLEGLPQMKMDITSGGKPIPLLQGIVKENDSNNSSPKAITTEETT